jgi:hypothetical protein
MICVASEVADGHVYCRSLPMIKERSGRSYDKPADFNFAFGVAVSAALIHSFALAAELYRAAESRSLISGSVTRLLLLIELCLLVNVAGLWARKATGMLASMVSLLVACAGYAGWYLYSRQVLLTLSSQPFYQLHPEGIPPHPVGLAGATWLNLLVLVITGVLLIWEAKTLRGMPRAPLT